MDSKVSLAIKQLEELRKKIGELMAQSEQEGHENPDLFSLISDYENLQAETDRICRETLGLSLEEGFKRWAKV